MTCSESDVISDTDRLGYQYFPLEVGSYKIYDVEETKYTVLEEVTEFYELKEVVIDSFLNASNNLIYVLHRFTRSDESESWHLDSIWTAQQTADIAILTENNVPYVKLSFPIEPNKMWDGNRMNSETEEFYRYNLNIQDSTLSDVTYSEIVQVIQNDQGEDILGIQNHSEIYAPRVGMILKESVNINYCQTDCESEKEIQSGRNLLMTIKSYGKE